MTEEPFLRTIKSFVVRGGRLTLSQQKALEQHWPQYGLKRQDGRIAATRIFGNDHPLVFEIGFGMAESLVQMARRHPEQNFIGVDVHPPGVGKLLRSIAENALANVRVYQDDATLVLDECIADGSLDKVQIFFPDPWHKKRHHKRRLIQPDFVQRLLPKLKVGGLIHLATDWENYAEQMLEVLSGTTQLENLAGDGRYCEDHQRPVTKFQQRGERLGHGVRDLLFRKSA